MNIYYLSSLYRCEEQNTFDQKNKVRKNLIKCTKNEYPKLTDKRFVYFLF